MTGSETGARLTQCARLDSIVRMNRAAKGAIGCALLIGSIFLLGGCSYSSAPPPSTGADDATGSSVVQEESPGGRAGVSGTSRRTTARGLIAADPWGAPVDSTNRCSKWSLDSLRLGMTIAEARRSHPDLHRDPGRDGQGVGGTLQRDLRFE